MDQDGNTIEKDLQPRRKNPVPIIITAAVAVLIAIIVFIVMQAVTKTGIFHPSGELIFDNSVSDQQREQIENSLQELELTANLNVQATYSLQGNLPENSVLLNVYVPITDFNDATISISETELADYKLTPVGELRSTEKLLAIDGNYYLDDFNSGAKFEYITLSCENSDELTKALALLSALTPPLPDQNNVLSLAQTGVTALSRGMTTKLGQVGDATYFAENIGDFLSSFDLTHTSNESSFSDSATSDNICANPKMYDALTAIGLDIVELTGNHNLDCGDQDALDTIEQYNNDGLKIFGGGETADAAKEPLAIEEKGTSLTLLGYNYSTGGYTLDDTPGANFYTEAQAIADITTAKERGDFVIVDIQYFECNNYVDTNECTICDYADSAEGDQIGFFRHLIDLGADLVIGTAAHQPQTFELYENGAIYYGLGNLFFDQSWWPGTTRGLVLVHYFYNGELIQTRIVPTVYDDDYQTTLMETTDASNFLKRLIDAQPTA